MLHVNHIVYFCYKQVWNVSLHLNQTPLCGHLLDHMEYKHRYKTICVNQKKRTATKAYNVIILSGDLAGRKLITYLFDNLCLFSHAHISFCRIFKHILYKKEFSRPLRIATLMVTSRIFNKCIFIGFQSCNGGGGGV